MLSTRLAVSLEKSGWKLLTVWCRDRNHILSTGRCGVGIEVIYFQQDAVVSG